jgi:transcription initiation factor TFIID subunit TAF12
MPPKTKQTKQAANKNSAKPQGKQQKKQQQPQQRKNKGQKKKSSGETKRPAASHPNTKPNPIHDSILNHNPKQNSMYRVPNHINICIPAPMSIIMYMCMSMPSHMIEIGLFYQSLF